MTLVDIIIASILAAVLLTAILHYSAVLHTPRYLVTVELPAVGYATARLTCSQFLARLGDVNISYIYAWSVGLNLTLKSQVSTIVEATELAVPGRGKSLMYARLAPNEMVEVPAHPPFTIFTHLAITAYPGDTLRLVHGGIERLSTSTIHEAPPLATTPGDWCPFQPGSAVKPTVEYDTIKGRPFRVGCAPVELDLDEEPARELLAILQLNDMIYWNETYDIPFYLHARWLGGFLVTPHGVGLSSYAFWNETFKEARPPHIILFHVNNTVVELYSDTVNLTMSQNAGGREAKYIYYGPARLITAKAYGPPIIIYAYGDGHHVKIDYVKEIVKLYSSSGSVLVSVPFSNVTFDYDDDIRRLLRCYSVAVYVNPDPTTDKILKFIGGCTGSGSNCTYRVYLKAEPDAVYDYFIVWEDLVGQSGYTICGTDIDANGDEWIRVTMFANGTWQISVYRSCGGFRHDVYAGDQKLFTKRHGYCAAKYDRRIGAYVPWYTRKIAVKGWEFPEVGAKVGKLLLFASGFINVTGLFPGDVVEVYSSRRSVTLAANSTSISIDVLSLFDPLEVAETILSGGFTIVVRPSPIHFQKMLPRYMFVHLIGDGVNVWLPVRVGYIFDCARRLEIRGDVWLEKLEDALIVHALGESGTRTDLGAFTRVHIIVYRGTVTVDDKAFTASNVPLVVYVRPDSVEVMESAKPLYHGPWSTIRVEGVARISGYYG